MTKLPLRTIDDAPEAAKELLVMAEKRNGFLPNLLRVLANAPVALETYLTVSGINARSSRSACPPIHRITRSRSQEPAPPR